MLLVSRREMDGRILSMKLPTRKEGIPHQVWLLGFVSFFNDIASEMLYPILPIFITQILGAPVAVVGVIEGFAEGFASLFKAIFGNLSDRMGRRKPFVVAGYASSAFSKAIIAVSTVWPGVFLGRLVDRLGKGLRTGARDSMLLSASTPENRGVIFGIHRSLDSAGAVLGPLLALLLLRVVSSIRSILWIAAIPAFFSLFLFPFVKEVRQKPDPSIPILRLTTKGFSKEFRLLLIALGVFSLGNSTDAFLILRAQGLGMSLTLIVLAYVLYNVLYMALSTPAGWVSDRIGSKRVMIAGILLYALVYFGFAFDTGASYVWLLFAVYGCYIALTDGVSKALASQFIDPAQSASAYGLMQMVTGLGALAASLIGGELWSLFSPQATFLFAATCAVLSLFVFAVLPAHVRE